MRSKQVDLHGLETDEAVIIAYQHLLEFQKNQIDSLVFITGKGTGALKTVIANLLDKEKSNIHELIMVVQ
ncbi:recombination and DNA strand exchange inhibitor protein [Mycoplasmopsis gallopavonis]|uniref:Recombination and DNA strand exchange inhibitor protein n=1 Tax=Mycoplasmopsis gallopavonis TaxID=76629 RepID=A0A449AZB6_9BACT|nr:Smr/MutS family protein [Mycoplasmopsis gallopavonis]VEU72827.1 recombination and DNA strand exchange inhibitor protein [Mycoplasmopsis gallopavonis]